MYAGSASESESEEASYQHPAGLEDPRRFSSIGPPTRGYIPPERRPHFWHSYITAKTLIIMHTMELILLLSCLSLIIVHFASMPLRNRVLQVFVTALIGIGVGCTAVLFGLVTLKSEKYSRGSPKKRRLVKTCFRLRYVCQWTGSTGAFLCAVLVFTAMYGAYDEAKLFGVCKPPLLIALAWILVGACPLELVAGLAMKHYAKTRRSIRFHGSTTVASISAFTEPTEEMTYADQEHQSAGTAATGMIYINANHNRESEDDEKLKMDIKEFGRKTAGSMQLENETRGGLKTKIYQESAKNDILMHEYAFVNTCIVND